MLQPAYDLSHRYTEHGRWHQCGAQGGLRPGVTTVLGRTMPAGREAFLADWRERVGHEAAERIKVRATDQGSWLHRRIECHLLGEHFVAPDGIELDEEQHENIEKMWRKMLPILGEVEEVYGIELPCFWEGPDPQKHDVSWGYAGSVDCVARIHGQLVVIDWKTTSSTPKPLHWLLAEGSAYDLQLAAYANALAHTYKELPPIDMAAIVIVAAKGRPQIIELDREDLTQAENAFGARLQAFYEQLRQAAEGDLLALA